MMTDMTGMMTWMMGGMMLYWAIVSVLVLVVLVLLAIWLFQKVRQGWGSDGTNNPQGPSGPTLTTTVELV